MSPPKILTAEFTLSVHRRADLPPPGRPEAAFLGRSNVGKSSLINTLLGRKRLVRTSSRPGCTRGLNFFLINGKWYFVDLPGYGYAAVSWQVREGWGPLIMDYLLARPSLKAVVFLQDPRRLPGEEELFLWEKLRGRGLPVLPVLTKADKVKSGERRRHLEAIAAGLSPFQLQKEDFLWFSALTQEGRERLWRALLGHLEGKGT
uniref:Probable GTP-binding protein EngB n=1 Tax=Desulfobacca acetoxidans TaxID=60893 RepID=A0A7V4GA51_9BACT